MWIGVRICSRTNTTPTIASGAARLAPCCTAPTSTPVASANAAGRTPRSSTTVHQPTASAASAFGRTLKNFHSLDSVSFRISQQSVAEFRVQVL